MLSTGFLGSACWSEVQPPTPYPLPFLAPAYQPFGWFLLTMVQPHLQAEALLMGSC